MSRRTVTYVVALIMVGSPSARACLWDRDTLRMERQTFPNALELITGKFLRHSPEFYRWRVEDRKRRIEASPNDPALYDDLGVAYDKLGEHAKAIETMMRKEEVAPGQYETYANLATFHVHAGDLPKSIELVERALAINPDAHFGREIYQKHLVNYLLSKQKDGVTKFPLRRAGDSESKDFAHYIFVQAGFAKRLEYGTDAPLTKSEIQGTIDPAVKGVLGMMRFARHDSPLLLEALGDLLLRQDPDANQLAARAYLKASYESQDEEARIAYRKKAEDARNNQVDIARPEKYLSLETLESHFKQELKDAKEWYAAVERDEAAWIAAGLDPDEEFDRKYYNEPEALDTSPRPSTPTPRPLTMVDSALANWQTSTWLLLLAGILLIPVTVVLIRIRRRKA